MSTSSIDVKISFHTEDRQLIKRIPNQITEVHIQKIQSSVTMTTKTEHTQKAFTYSCTIIQSYSYNSFPRLIVYEQDNLIFKSKRETLSYCDVPPFKINTTIKHSFINNFFPEIVT